jgi:hypothetical protein
MSIVVTDVEVAAYRGLVAQVAKRYVGVGGAEFDDLEQEGWIAAWGILSTGLFRPSVLIIERACVDWVRYCSRRGFGREAYSEE